MTDTDLYERAMRTTAACWAAFARGTIGARVHRLPHVSVAIFTNEPERSLYNSSILERDLDRAERAAALDAIEALYAAAGISRFAAWVHETDRAMRAELTRRGYTVDTSTRAMGMPLHAVSPPQPEIELGLGTALTSKLVHDAAARGCRTASLQSTPVAERIHAALGFRDLGRIVEYVPTLTAR